jgi:hypothetical protein
MKTTLKAIALVVAALTVMWGTRFETYHYRGSFWTLNRYTGSIMRCVPTSLNEAGGCEEVGRVQ